MSFAVRSLMRHSADLLSFVAACGCVTAWLNTPAIAQVPSPAPTATPIPVPARSVSVSVSTNRVATPGTVSPATWARWAGFAVSPGRDWYTLDTDAPDNVTGSAVRTRETVGVQIINTSPDTPLRVACAVPLSAGLWQTEAALFSPITGIKGDGVLMESAPLRTWRMESALKQSEGEARKTVSIPPGHTLYLRFTNTHLRASNALQATRDSLGLSGNSVMRPRVENALQPVGEAIGVIPVLVARGDRAKIVKRMHMALLALGKAQAVWRNWRETDRAEGDAAFESLVTSLSEVSAASCNLVASEIIETDNGKPQLRITLTNAGGQTVPYVALGLSYHATPEAVRTVSDKPSEPTDRFTAFRNVKPGAKVSAVFALPESFVSRATSTHSAEQLLPVHGIAQFVLHMGAGAIPAGVYAE